MCSSDLLHFLISLISNPPFYFPSRITLQNTPLPTPSSTFFSMQIPHFSLILSFSSTLFHPPFHSILIFILFVYPIWMPLLLLTLILNSVCAPTPFLETPGI